MLRADYYGTKNVQIIASSGKASNHFMFAYICGCESTWNLWFSCDRNRREIDTYGLRANPETLPGSAWCAQAGSAARPAGLLEYRCDLLVRAWPSIRLRDAFKGSAHVREGIFLLRVHSPAGARSVESLAAFEAIDARAPDPFAKRGILRHCQSAPSAVLHAV